MYRQLKSQNKYHAESQTYNGHKYDSLAEASYAMWLDAEQREGRIRSWIPHPRLDLRVKGRHVLHFKVDFQVTHLDGRIEFAEVKGLSTDGFRAKWRLLESVHEELWPGSELTLIKVGQKRWTKEDVERYRGKVFGAKA